MNDINEILKQKGAPKVFFNTYKEKRKSFFIYEFDEEFFINQKGCFLNGKKINGNPFNILNDCIQNWKKETDDIACVGFLSYDLKGLLYPNINFSKKKDDVPLCWFGKPKKNFYVKNKYKTDKIPEINSINSKNEYLKYKKNLEKIKNKLKSGDVYQVNYTYPKIFETNNDIIELFFYLSNISKPHYGWFFDINTIQILCFSPEQFFTTNKEKIYSSPIKGTMKRSQDKIIDNYNKTILENSIKDKAENLMITDLIRNDLGKICQYGSIKVDEIFNIVSFETVHHMISKVSGILKSNINEIDIIKALFPGGSITGAPKESSMKIIDNLENYSREIYTGSIGYIKSNGDMDFNIAIRTMLNKDGKLKYPVGGGIVWDSKIENEWEETKTKAKILHSITK